MDIQTLIQNVQQAVRGDINADNKWRAAGESVRTFYGTETAVNEVKAQFIADCIMPAIDKRHATALAKELPRKGSADYVAFVGAHGAQAWEDANQAKKDARATAHTYYARVLSYAFPKEKKERTPTALQTRIINEVGALIKACQKAEDASFDVSRTIAALDAVLAAVVPKA